MLYFKTKKGRLIIQIQIDVNHYIYMLVCPNKDNRVHGYYSYVDEKVWEKFRKISEPQILEDNNVDYEIYTQAIENEDNFQQEMSDQDWMMGKATDQMWREAGQSLIKNGITPLVSF